jgi:hypothetical protein
MHDDSFPTMQFRPSQIQHQRQWGLCNTLLLLYVKARLLQTQYPTYSDRFGGCDDMLHGKGKGECLNFIWWWARIQSEMMGCVQNIGYFKASSGSCFKSVTR